MIVYRCTLLKWSKDLSGTGAFLYGGRWNSPGVNMLYTAENNVLAAFEIALRIPLDQISKNYVMVPLTLPDTEEIPEPVLSKQWYKELKTTRGIGDGFIRDGKHLLMKVPSALISDSFNYLLNPKHELVKKIRVMEPKSILFDKRLIEIIRSKGS
jgi:RES domain-containing protein